MAKIRALSSLIHGVYDSEAAMARDLGWAKQRLNKITTGQKEPDIIEATQIADKLRVSVNDIAQIFLSAKSPNGQF
jgi:DNA-binding XRE family transcriptional regulator